MMVAGQRASDTNDSWRRRRRRRRSWHGNTLLSYHPRSLFQAFN